MLLVVVGLLVALKSYFTLIKLSGICFIIIWLAKLESSFQLNPACTCSLDTAFLSHKKITFLRTEYFKSVCFTNIFIIYTVVSTVLAAFKDNSAIISATTVSAQCNYDLGSFFA